MTDYPWCLDCGERFQYPEDGRCDRCDATGNLAPAHLSSVDECATSPAWPNCRNGTAARSAPGPLPRHADDVVKLRVRGLRHAPSGRMTCATQCPEWQDNSVQARLEENAVRTPTRALYGLAVA